MKQNTIIISSLILAGAILLLAGILLFKPLSNVQGAAFTGQAAYLQNATTSVVGPQDPTDTIFSASEDGSCKSRVISTGGLSAITLNFGDPGTDRAGNISSTTLSGNVGHVQAASTTVAYDSGLFGCGRWSAFSYATQTLTLSEF